MAKLIFIATLTVTTLFAQHDRFTGEWEYSHDVNPMSDKTSQNNWEGAEIFGPRFAL